MSKLKPTRVPVRQKNGKVGSGIRYKNSTPAAHPDMLLPPSKVPTAAAEPQGWFDSEDRDQFQAVMDHILDSVESTEADRFRIWKTTVGSQRYVSVLEQRSGRTTRFQPEQFNNLDELTTTIHKHVHPAAAPDFPDWLRDGQGHVRPTVASLLAEVEDPATDDYRRRLASQEAALHPEATAEEFRAAFDPMPMDLRTHVASQVRRRDLAESLLNHRGAHIRTQAERSIASVNQSADRAANEDGATIRSAEDQVVYGDPAYRLHMARTSSDSGLLERLAQDSEPWVREAAER